MVENGQISFIELLEAGEQKQTGPAPAYDPEEWALVYLVTRRGGYKGNLFILRIQDAKKLCEDPCSRGMGRGGEWIFMWTTIAHFIRKDDTYGDSKHVGTELPRFLFLADTGKQDKDFERLGIKKPSFIECEEIIRSIGYQIDYTYKRES